MKFWQIAVLVGLGFAIGWLVWGRKSPPPAGPVVEIRTDTVLRVDTVKIASSALLAEISRIRGVLRGFLENPIRDTTDTCIVYLTQAAALIDSLRRAVTTPPALRLALDDSLTAKWPIKALWVGVRYVATGDSATERWEYRQWPAPLPDKGRLGAVFGYGAKQGGGVGLQVRLDQSKALQAVKSEKGWSFGAVWFLF